MSDLTRWLSGEDTVAGKLKIKCGSCGQVRWMFEGQEVTITNDGSPCPACGSAAVVIEDDTPLGLER